MIIKVTFKNKTFKYVKEDDKKLSFVDDITKAYDYESTLEFKVSWYLWSSRGVCFVNYRYVGRCDSKDDDNILKFETVDATELKYFTRFLNKLEIELKTKLFKTKKFDLLEPEVDVLTEPLYFNEKDFNSLKKCGITGSHRLSDKDGNHIPFPKGKEDYDRVEKIKYYKRGLIDTISSDGNWNRRYGDAWHPSYRGHHTLMLNPIIQQILLTPRLDSCFEFIILKKPH